VFVPLAALDLTVLTVWLVFLAGITLPIWYRAPRQTFGNGGTAYGVQLGYFPNGPHGHPGYGLYVDTLPTALLAATILLTLFLLFNYVLVATARARHHRPHAAARPGRPAQGGKGGAQPSRPAARGQPRLVPGRYGRGAQAGVTSRSEISLRPGGLR
jgi:hypothetical protein